MRHHSSYPHTSRSQDNPLYMDGNTEPSNIEAAGPTVPSTPSMQQQQLQAFSADDIPSDLRAAVLGLRQRKPVDYKEKTVSNVVADDSSSEEVIIRRKPAPKPPTHQASSSSEEESEQVRAASLGLRVRSKVNYKEKGEKDIYKSDDEEMVSAPMQKKKKKKSHHSHNDKKKSSSSKHSAKSSLRDDDDDPWGTKASRRTSGRSDRVRYNDDDDDDSDWVDKDAPAVAAPVGPQIDKILGVRKSKEKGRIGEDEFLVKWKDLSYMHVEWLDKDATLQIGGAIRLKTFWKKKEEKDMLADIYEGAAEAEEGYFDDGYLEIERIVAEREVPAEDGMSPPQKQFFIKWRAGDHDECTWEDVLDIKDDVALEQYNRFKKVPDPNLWLPTGSKRPANRIAYTSADSFKNGNTLREYQIEGANWIAYQWHHHTNCVLADEMGLGKTVQSVISLHYLQTKQRRRGPFIVIAPLSTIPHWQREFEAWTDMNVIVLKGNQAARDCIYRYEFHFLNSNCVPVFKSSFKFNVLITTYEIMMKEVDRLSAIEWEAMIVDEAHRLKNTESKACQSIAQFSKVHHKVLLTGTPLQNNTTEIFGLFSVVDPVRFSNVEEFLAKFGNLTKSEEVESLQQELQPYMLRRKKEDVEKSLPSKEETVIEVELSKLQRKTYTAILEKNFAALTAPDAAVPALRNVMMELRKCCNHPYLIDSVEQNAMLSMDNPGDVTAMNYNFVHDSGKMILLHKMLPKLKRDGHRVLIFSQFVRVLDLLERYMQFIGRYQFERIDGSIRGNERQAAIDRYSMKDSEKFVFLICTKAGGLGINLTAADTVIIFDSDWNPQNDIQAMARAHRIGQLRQVSIYRFITARSYESEMFDRASKKLGLEQAVMTGLNAKQQQDKRLSKKEIEELLKSGAMQVLTSGEEAFKKWEDMDIDQILETKTRKIVENAVPTAVPGAVKLSFSKAIMKENLEVEEEVALDDVNFWEKLMPEASAALNESRARAFADEGPRLRKQVERYGAVADAEYEERKKKDINDWTNKEIFKLTSGLESFGFGRWSKLLSDHSTRTDVELSWAALELIRILAQEQDGVNGQNARDVLKWLLGGFEPIRDHPLSDIARKSGNIAATLFISKSGKIKRSKMWNRLKDIAVLRDAISEACVNAGCDSSPEALESVTLDSPQWQSLALPSIAENSDFAKWDQAADLCLLWTVWVHGVTGIAVQLNSPDSPMHIMTMKCLDGAAPPPPPARPGRPGRRSLGGVGDGAHMKMETADGEAGEGMDGDMEVAGAYDAGDGDADDDDAAAAATAEDDNSLIKRERAEEGEKEDGDAEGAGGDAVSATKGVSATGIEDGDGDGEVGEIGGSAVGPLAGCVGILKARAFQLLAAMRRAVEKKKTKESKMTGRVKKSKAKESLDEKEEVRLMRAIMEFGWGLGAKTGAPDSDEAAIRLRERSSLVSIPLDDFRLFADDVVAKYFTSASKPTDAKDKEDKSLSTFQQMLPKFWRRYELQQHIHAWLLKPGASGSEVTLFTAAAESGEVKRYGRRILPSWWASPQDDLALAQGLRKHGLGRWKEILDDDGLVFSCGVEERLKAKGKGGKPKREIPKGSDASKAGIDADSKGGDASAVAGDANAVEDKLDCDEMGAVDGGDGGVAEQGGKESGEGADSEQLVSWEPRSDTMYIYVGLLATSLKDCATKKPADHSVPKQRSISDFVRPSGKSKIAASDSDFVAVKATLKPSAPKAAGGGVSGHAGKSTETSKGDVSKDIILTANQPALHARVPLPPLKDGDVDVLAWGTIIFNCGNVSKNVKYPIGFSCMSPMWGQKRWRCDIVQGDGGGMEFHVTDVDSQTTYVSDLSPSDVWRRVSSALKVKPPPPGLKMFGLDRKAVREGVATTFKKLVKEMLVKPKAAQSASASLSSSSSAIAGGAAGAGALKRPSAEVQRSTF